MQDYLKSYWYYLKKRIILKSGKDLIERCIRANSGHQEMTVESIGGFFVPLSSLKNLTRWTRVVKCDL